MQSLTLQWCHDECDGVSNHWHLYCLLNHLFRCSKHQSSTSLAFVRGFHLWPVDSPHQGPATWMFSFDDVIMDFITKCFLIIEFLIKIYHMLIMELCIRCLFHNYYQIVWFVFHFCSYRHCSNYIWINLLPTKVLLILDIWQYDVVYWYVYCMITFYCSPETCKYKFD